MFQHNRLWDGGSEEYCFVVFFAPVAGSVLEGHKGVAVAMVDVVEGEVDGVDVYKVVGGYGGHLGI